MKIHVESCPEIFTKRNVIPSKIWAPWTLKYFENKSTLTFADISTNFKFGYCGINSRRTSKRKSVCWSLSCTSSWKRIQCKRFILFLRKHFRLFKLTTIICVTESSASLLPIIVRNKIPFVQKVRTVLTDILEFMLSNYAFDSLEFHIWAKP